MIERGWRASLAGLATTICFSSSAIFIRYGLETLSSPLIGVAISMAICAIAYAILLFIREQRRSDSTNLWQMLWQIDAIVLRWQLLAGILVGLATWVRWIALDDAPVAVVRLSVPVVLILSPWLVGQKYEEVNGQVWLGAGLILMGSLILTLL